jgi:LmbE family N-acetylglucosaminyl deacetylase
MKILAFGSHPDDIEYGCGGFLLDAVRSGHDAYMCVMTDGGVNPEFDRRLEQERAASFLGAKGLFWGGFRDTQLQEGRELINAIEYHIGKVNPDIVLVNYYEDAHQDHRALAVCAVTACRYQKKVLFYHDYTTLNFIPDVFIDIGNFLQDKRTLLAYHHSQVNKKYPTGLDLLESINSLAAYYGFMAKVRYAEGFKALRYLIDI